MPQVHTYIRNEDMDKWKALENKSLFIHNALNNLTVSASDRLVEAELPREVRSAIKTINQPEEEDEWEEVDPFAGWEIVDYDLKQAKNESTGEWAHCKIKNGKIVELGEPQPIES